MPWGQQRWASLGATANLRCQRGGLGAPSCPHGTFVQQTTGGLAPKQGGTWEDPEGLLALAPPSGVPGAAPGDAMGVLGLELHKFLTTPPLGKKERNEKGKIAKVCLSSFFSLGI